MAEYIERMTAISVACKGCNKEFPNEPCEPAECYIQQGLFAIPTADVVEVRHGKWKMRGGWFRCSVCDGKALLQDVGGTGGFSHEYEQVKSEYCPHCFAKMDGGAE